MKERKADAWMPTGFMEGGFPAESGNQFGSSNASSSSPISNRAGMKPTQTPEEMRKSLSKSKRKSLNDTIEKMDSSSNNNRASMNVEKEKETEAEESAVKTRNVFEDFDDGDDDNQQGSDSACGRCMYSQETFMGMKIDSFVRLFKVVMAFPFVIVVSSLNLSNKYSFLRFVTIACYYYCLL